MINFRTIALLIAALVLCPLWLPFVLIYSWLDDRRRLKVAKTTRCSQCKGQLGREAVRLADEAQRETIQNLRRQFAGSKLRQTRTVWAICPACGAGFDYQRRDRAYVIINQEESNN